jgi:hypothetical protein
MNIKIFAAIVGLSVSSAAMPQSALIDMPDFRPLESKAKDCVNISLGPWLLHSLGLFLDEKDPDTAATKKLLRGIDSIQVRSFEFDSDSAYSQADMEAVRRQLNAPGWTSLMTMHDRNSGENVDMYMLIRNEQTRGFALIASEPRKFTIINIAGTINVSELPKLEKELHLGKLIPDQDVLMRWPAAAQL